ncbi:MAG: cytochrome c biogenesis protein CcdA [bacterium]
MIDPHFGAAVAGHPVEGVFAAFGGGLLASFSPCLYPMIPVTVAIVGGGGTSSRARTFGLALVYAIGLATTYSILGLVAGLSGTLFGGVSTNPWLYLAMGNVMLLAAAMMADIIPVPMPAALHRYASTAGTGGRITGAFVMGAVSGLVAAPCGAPVLAGILTWVATTHSASLGFLYLFAFSFGMCALLLVMSVGADSALRLPRPGAWMINVKRFFALVLVGVAEYYLISMGQLIT